MFNRFKLLACFIEIHVYASASKKRRILLASLPAGFYAFPIILNMSSENRILLNSTELSCEFLFSICLLLCLSSLLLLSCLLLSILLLSRILSGSLWLDRSANFCCI